MHFHFPFTTLQVLWTLTFAAHLVLLVVLMGRDRVRQFPWFTAYIVLVAFRLLTSQMLFGRIPQMTAATIFIITACVGAFLSLMVVVEVARRAFAGVRRAYWMTGALAMLVVGAAVLWFWGTWPAWKTITSGPPLQLGQLLAQKGMLLGDVENIAVGLLIVVLGRRTGAGFKSKVQQVAIGLMTASLSQLSIQVIWERIAKTAVAHSREEYAHIIGLRERLFNTNNVVYIAVLVWWICCLWIEQNREQKDKELGTGNREQETTPVEEIVAEDGVALGRELPPGPEQG